MIGSEDKEVFAQYKNIWVSFINFKLNVNLVQKIYSALFKYIETLCPCI